MFGNTSTSKGRDEAYRCSRSRTKHDCTASRISRRKLEEAVFHTLKEYILLPDSLAALYDLESVATERRASQRSERLAILAEEKKKLNTQIAHITRAIAEHGHSSAILEKLTELESRRAQTLSEITELASTPLDPLPSVTEQEITALSQNLIHTLLSSPPETVRKILGSFIYKIRAKKENGTIIGSITYFVPPKPQPPPFDNAPTEDNSLPIRRSSVGAPHSHRQGGCYF